MKQLFAFNLAWLLLFSTLGVSTAHAQGVGIGTTTPSANAALDVFSTNKGLMFPRVDTAAVANPSAGLLIYSQQLKAPAYHNGTRWNKMTGTTSAATGITAAAGVQAPSSIAYTITMSNGTVTTGTFATVFSMTQGAGVGVASGGGGVSAPSFSEVSIQKAIDANSIPFINSLAGAKTIASIEFKVYYSPGGVSTLYYSLKLTTVYVSGYSVNFTDLATEQLSFNGQIYGFKNWITGQGYSYNTITNTAGNY